MLFLIGLPWSLLGTWVFTDNDRTFHSVQLDWRQAWLLHGGAWDSQPIAYPLRGALAQTDWMLGQALIGLPFRELGLDPSHLHSLLVLIGMWMTGYACWLAAVALTGRGPHAWVAAIAGGPSTYAMAHTTHVNLVFQATGIAGALLIAAGAERRDARLGVAGGLLVGATAHFGVYMGLQALVIAAVVVVGALLARRGTVASWAATLAGLGASLLTFVPVARLYHQNALDYEIRVLDREILGTSVDVAAMWRPIPSIPAHRWVIDAVGMRPGNDQDPAIPGYVLLALAGAGLVALARSGRLDWRWRTVVAVGVTGFLLALGPELHVAGNTGLPAPWRLVQELPGFGALRGPGRWMVLPMFAGALLAAQGAAWAAARFGVAGVVGAVLLVCAELSRGPIPWTIDRVAVPRFYDRVAELPPGAIHDVSKGGEDCRPEQKLNAVMLHRRPSVGGAYARAPIALMAVNRVALNWPARPADLLLRRLGVRVVVQHPPLAREAPPGATCEVVEGHRLCVLEPPFPMPLPPPDAVTEAPNGPMIGARYPVGTEGPFVATCDGGPLLDLPVRVAEALRLVRVDPQLDVFFDRPCPGRVDISPFGGTPLYRAPGREAATWLPETPPWPQDDRPRLIRRPAGKPGSRLDPGDKPTRGPLP